MSAFTVEAGVYLDHVVSLLVPGRRVRSHDVVPPDVAQVGDLAGWTEAELDLLIEECRRALDQQHGRFDRMRTTAQVVLPLSTALLVVLGSQLHVLIAEPTTWVRYLMYGLWLLGTVLVLFAGLGAAATLSVRSEFGTVLPTRVSQLTSPVRPKVAHAYAEQVVTGEITLGTRVTVIRDAVTLLAVGGSAHLILWLVLAL